MGICEVMRVGVERNSRSWLGLGVDAAGGRRSVGGRALGMAVWVELELQSTFEESEGDEEVAVVGFRLRQKVQRCCSPIVFGGSRAHPLATSLRCSADVAALSGGNLARLLAMNVRYSCASVVVQADSCFLSDHAWFLLSFEYRSRGALE